MAALIYLDTHVVAWLYAGELEGIPATARERIEANDLWISPAVQLELSLLFEIGRTTAPADTVITALHREIGLAVCDLPFSEVVTAASIVHWTRDPFDRLIVGQAEARQAPLLTKDRLIRQHFSLAVWGEREPEPQK